MGSNYGRFVAAALSLACGSWSGAVLAADAVPAPLDANEVLGDLGRTPWDVARDPLRKPATVLSFAQVKPGQVVVDLVPDDGYYTRILAKMVGIEGRVYAIVPNGGGAGTRGARQQQRDGKSPSAVPVDDGAVCSVGCYPVGKPPYVLPVDQMLAIQNITEYRKNMKVFWEALDSYGGSLAIPEQADLVFTANAYHQLHYGTVAVLNEGVPGRVNNVKPLDVLAFDKSVFYNLKPGGMFLVTDYAAAKGAGFSVADTLQRVEADAVKKEAIAAGFVLDGESFALASRRDDKSKPVAGTNADRDKADQFILRFKKPDTASGATKRPTKEEEAQIMKNYYGNTFIGRADLTELNPANGNRTRFHYYNPDYTYQEFGRLGEGPGPMQAGSWFWDADAHNCQIHQFPADERQNVVCHVDVQLDANIPFDTLSDGYYGGRPAKVTMKRGHIMQFPVKTPD